MLNLSMKWITFSMSTELAVEYASLLVLEDETIVKHSGCPKLSEKRSSSPCGMGIAIEALTLLIVPCDKGLAWEPGILA